MVKLNMAINSDEGSISPKVLVYQRTPTPRYEHWPQSPVTSHSKGDTTASKQNLSDNTEKHKEDDKKVVDATTKLDTPHTTVNSSCDPPDSSHDPGGNSHDPDSGSKVPKDCSHDPAGGSCDQNILTIPVNSVHNSSHELISDSQDSSSQANS